MLIEVIRLTTVSLLFVIITYINYNNNEKCFLWCNTEILQIINFKILFNSENPCSSMTTSV